MGSLAHELQLVFESAVAALSTGDGGDALDCYFLARSRIRFVLGAVLGGADAPAGEPDPALAVVAAACRQVESTLTAALERLSQTGPGTCSPSLTGMEEDDTQQASAIYEHVGAGLVEAQAGTQHVQGQRGKCGSAGGTSAVPDKQLALDEVVQRCLRKVSGSLDDVVGLAAIKQELRESLLLPLHLPHLFTGIRRPQSNVLFHGRPGTGKTLLVEKAAAEAGIPLLAISPSTVLSKWSGESEKSLRCVFEAAASASPAIVFIDEVDALAPARAPGDDLSARRVLTELLLCMTEASSRPAGLVFVMACTNRLEDCDPALLRRFERKIEVPPPDAEARAAFFTSTVQRPEVASQLSCDEVQLLAEKSEGMTGSDLAVACRDAAMAPLRELMLAFQAGQLAAKQLAGVVVRPVKYGDFVAAITRTMVTE